jgi:Zn-dependent peptidase ImmA (M78 family)
VAIALDLMALDGKATPDALAAEIFRQNPEIALPVSVHEIAAAAGILEIRSLTSDGFEGMLISNPEKSEGVIFVNQNRPPQRQRFTIGHEVGHFLLPWHRNVHDGSLRFQCTTGDMAAHGFAQANSRLDWEIQANVFASEILFPRQLFKKHMKRKDEPDLQHVLDLAALFDMSVEATARRYVALSDYPIAMIFARGTQVRHAWTSTEFPYYLEARKGSSLPRVSQSFADGPSDTLDEFEYVDSHWWINAERGRAPPEKVLEQTLFQREGYRIVMLHAEDQEDADSE